jgi:hypothetical protein
MRELPIDGGRAVALVDDDDYARLAAHVWSISWNGYVVRRPRPDGKRRVMVYMHRDVLGVSGNELVDHKDMNKLDNRKENLRHANKSTNGANCKKRERCSSVFKGVCWHAQRSKWVAYVTHQQKRRYLGVFHDETAAARAYNAAASALFGEFARLNPV